jgi:cGMP-dependent protein kinase
LTYLKPSCILLAIFENFIVFFSENIVPKMFYCEVEPEQFIFQQGDNASSYFIVDHGSLNIIINNEIKRTVKDGEGFGELALLFNAPRSASVKALEHCGLWGIDRNTFRKAVEEMSSKQCKENRKFMENVNFFQNLTIEQKDSIASVLTTQKFKKGEFIVAEGDPASSFYVIKSGEVAVLKGEKEIRKMVKGDSFGEQALYYNTVRSCSVRADGEVRCLALGREVLTKILGAQIQVITFKNIMKWAFEKNKSLMKLTQIQIEKLLELMEIVQVKKGEVISSKNEVCQKFIIVLEGSLETVIIEF